MRLVIYADLHLGAPHALKMNPMVEGDKSNVFLLGDIIDFRNIKYKEIPQYKVMYNSMLAVFGARYVKGNHEVSCGKGPYYLKWGKVLLCHGHSLDWSDEKVEKWENYSPGANSFKREMVRFFYRFRWDGKHKKADESTCEEAFELCKKFGCDTVILGHTHNFSTTMYKGIKVIKVPRGRTVVDV